MCKRVLMFLFLGVLLISTLSAAEYYVSPTGTASWANCQSETPLSGTECCSLSTANTNLQPGDTVYFREGIYNTVQQYGVGLDITNKQGNLDNRIILQNYNNELVEFKGIYGVRQWGFMIQSSSYIQLKGFIFSDYSDYLTRHFSNHIEITECTFRNTVSPYRGGSVQFVEACIGGSSVTCPVNNIWFHNNTLYRLTAGGGCSGSISEGGDSFRIGYHSGICYGGVCAQGLNSHFTVEDNYMAYGGHAVMDSYSIYSVFRNNVAHNEPWYPADNGDCQVTYLPEYTNEDYNGLYSHRVWAFTDTHSRNYSYNLIENNRLGHAGVNPNNDGSTGLVIASPGNIIRYNSAYGTMNSPMKTKWGDDIGWQSNGGTRNRIYSNTIYTGGYGYPYFQTCTNQQLSTCPKPLLGFRWYYPHNSAGNHLKNNIVYGSYGAVEKNLKDIQDDTSGVIYSNNLCTNVDLVKCSVVGDPLFINPDLSDTTSHTLPNLRLQADSPAIDTGIHLTLSTNSGSNSINLVVENALYFQDGSWGSSLSQGVTHFPDWIAIGNVDNVVQISSINYSSNTITLDSPMTWNDNDLVWLYKKSDGERVLYGSGPDIGAYEFQEDSGEIWAENCSQEAVQQAIDSAEDGDTVRVPAGECVWNQSVKIGEQTNWNPDLYESKEIVLRGEGIDDTTIISHEDYGETLLSITLESNKSVRVTGFTFEGMQKLSTTYPAIDLGGEAEDWRIDHCKFDSTNTNGRGLIVRGKGVVDNNLFVNTYQGVAVIGDGDLSWNTSLSLGTLNSVYVENNIFDYDDDFDGALDAYRGARYVFRNNKVINTSAGHHGRDSGGYRSTHSYEYYGNNFTKTGGSGIIGLNFRGGTGVVFNNTWIADGASWQWYRSISTVNYCSCPENFSSCGWPACTNYPCIDQIGRTTDHDNNGVQDLEPLYEWNNLNNGGDQNFSVNNPCSEMDDHIQEGRDFYNNIEKPNYTPYIYPHPLTTAPFGTEICGEGPISSECWCEGSLRTEGSCEHGYYFTSSGCNHPAEQGTPDCKISLNELTDYVNQWKTNLDISINEVMDAISKWKAGGY